MRILTLASLFALVLGVIGGCDPCFGVGQCVGEPRFSIEGALILHSQGAPYDGVADAEVEFERTAGVALESGNLVATTDEEGRYSMATGAEEEGTVVGNLTIRPTGHPDYTVEGVILETSRRRGEGHVFPQWVLNPYFPYAGELFSRRTGELLTNARVSFHRTGGVQLRGSAWRGGQYNTRTDSGGRFILFHNVSSLGIGEVVGDLRVTPEGETETWMIRGVRLKSTPIAYHPWQIARWGVGPSLNYVGQIRSRALDDHAVGAEIEFRRTGGLAATPERFTARTDAGGRFPFHLKAATRGEVVGDLYVRVAGASQADTISNVRIPTFESDEVRLLGVWNAGYMFNHVGRVVWEETGEGLSGVTIEFRRTGGVRVSPERYEFKTIEAGYFALQPSALEEGEVLFELRVQVPGAEEPFVISDLSMTSFYGDRAEPLRTWYIPSP